MYGTPGDIIEGIRLVKKVAGYSRKYISALRIIKPIAIDNLTELLENDPDINVIELESPIRRERKKSYLRLHRNCG